MPIYDSDRVEYEITSGHIHIIMEGGKPLPAYWAHPNVGRKFPAVALIHDWWGITPIIRRMTHHFAQAGYYVIVPDLFDGNVATTPQEAMDLVKGLRDEGFPRVDAALTALETHHNTNRDVAAVGIGMGGSLAFEAAIERQDLEAAVAYYGFPQRYLGRFRQANTPILAVFGDHDEHISVEIITKLRRELAANTHGLAHEVLLLEGGDHNFFADTSNEAQREKGRQALDRTFTFLDKYLKGPQRTTSAPEY
ncbi:MAG: dienelactone hydrolase family protein [Anaerolineae bacterium]